MYGIDLECAGRSSCTVWLCEHGVINRDDFKGAAFYVDRSDCYVVVVVVVFVMCACVCALARTCVFA